jgi:hypothetical protein
MSFVANSFKDACEFLVCHLIDQAYGTTNTRASDQVVPTGSDGDEYATVRIISSDADYGSAHKSFQSANYPAWSVAVTYAAGALVSVGANAYVCTLAVTGGAGPASDTTHWSATAQSTQIVETSDNLYTFTTSIQFFRHKTPAVDGAGLAQFGLGAFDKAARLVAQLGQQDMLDLMDVMNIGIDDNSPARNVSALVNSAYFEDRGSVDITFTIPNSETLLLNTFAAVGISLQFASPGQPAPDTRTITESQP